MLNKDSDTLCYKNPEIYFCHLNVSGQIHLWSNIIETAWLQIFSSPLPITSTLRYQRLSKSQNKIIIGFQQPLEKGLRKTQDNSCEVNPSLLALLCLALPSLPLPSLPFFPSAAPTSFSSRYFIVTTTILATNFNNSWLCTRKYLGIFFTFRQVLKMQHKCLLGQSLTTHGCRGVFSIFSKYLQL